MRGLLPGLASPHPVGPRLPGLYQEDDFIQRLCAGLDEILAPVLLTLDGMSAYFDPRTTPDDMLGWLAGWVGLTLADGQSVDRQRELIAAGVGLLQWRGTARGVRDAVQSLVGVQPEIEDSGGSEWSTSPSAALPGSPGARLSVSVTVPDLDAVDVQQLHDLIAAIKPAHVVHHLEIHEAGPEGYPLP
jgi:phage tail-like protein